HRVGVTDLALAEADRSREPAVVLVHVERPDLRRPHAVAVQVLELGTDVRLQPDPRVADVVHPLGELLELLLDLEVGEALECTLALQRLLREVSLVHVAEGLSAFARERRLVALVSQRLRLRLLEEVALDATLRQPPRRLRAVEVPSDLALRGSRLLRDMRQLVREEMIALRRTRRVRALAEVDVVAMRERARPDRLGHL